MFAASRLRSLTKKSLTTVSSYLSRRCLSGRCIVTGFSLSYSVFPSLIFPSLTFPNVANAQIIPDNTLPINSQVTPNCTSCTINLGTVKGANLFHSFSEFSIPTGGEAHFNNDLDIENIFTRVTGSQLSNIDGLLRTNGNASLFLLNPNGIIFGPNARLDINGSFTATTAESLKFFDGSEFSTTNTQAQLPLLTISVAPGLQYGEHKAGATISTRGNLTVGQDLTLFANKLDLQGHLEAGNYLTLSSIDALKIEGNGTNPFVAVAGNTLEVIANQTLDILSGGNIKLLGFVDTSSIDDSDGDVQLLAGENTTLASFGDIRLEGVGDITLSKSVININSQTNSLNNYSTINIISTGGSVFLDGVFLYTNNSGNGYAGDIGISGSDQIQINNSAISTEGYAGQIYLGQSEYSSIQPHHIVLNNSRLSSSTNTNLEKGDIGGIDINSRDSIKITNRSQVSSRTTLFNNGGDINIDTNSFLLERDSILDTSTKGAGNGGDINFSVKSMIVDGAIIRFGAIDNSSGDGGSLNIKADNLALQSNASFEGDVNPGATGKGGNANLTITDTLLMDGASKVVAPTGESTRITVGVLSGGSGQGGDANIKAGSFVMKNGAIIKSSAQGDGFAGKINVTAKNVDISGSVPLDSYFAFELRGGLPSGLFSSGDRNGQANVITVNADNFRIADGAMLSTRTTGNQPGGDIKVNAKNQFIAMNGGQLFTTAFGSGNAGSISVNSPNIEIAGNDSTFQQRVDRINSYKDFVPNFGFVANDITNTNIGNSSGLFAGTGLTSTGNGGNIDITTNLLSLKNTAEITASSLGSGQAGKLKISATHLTLDDKAKILAQTISGKGGDINLQDLKTLRLNNRSLISATTVDGQGGKISIFASELVDIDSNSALVAEAKTTDETGVVDTATLFLSNLNNNPNNDTIGNTTSALVTEAKGNAGNMEIFTGLLNLNNGSLVSVSNRGSGNAGKLQVSANQIILNNGTKIFAETNSGSGGDINLQDLKSLNLSNLSLISATTEDGIGGNISITASESVNIDSASFLLAEAKVKGDAGDVKISTGKLNLNNGIISVSNRGSGQAGQLKVFASNVSLDNKAKIFAETKSGSGGDINLQDFKSLRLANTSLISATTIDGKGGDVKIQAGELVDINSNSFVLAEAKGKGDAGNMEISTTQLNLNNGLISVSNRGSGEAGFLQISANQVSLDNQAKIFAETKSGSGGDINLQDLKSLRLANGSLISATTIDGKSGNVKIQARDLINIDNSSIFAEAKRKGNAGNVEISTPKFYLNNNASVSVSSPSGIAGNLTITANNLLLNQSKLKAETGVGDSPENANISLGIKDLLYMQNNSLISAEAFNNAKGGNITINNTDGFIVANKNSDINANASEGNGGNINITTQGIFGLKFRDSQTNESDITASSKFGLSGSVTINTLSIDPSKGLVELPASVASATNQISSSCSGSGNVAQKKSSFTVTGRDRLPSSPNEIFTPQQTLVETFELSQSSQPKVNNNSNHNNYKNNNTSTSINPKQLTIEAQGWIVDNEGRIHLVTEVPHPNHQSPTGAIISCDASP
jgi:filamentous hemagglutinin family protein